MHLCRACGYLMDNRFSREYDFADFAGLYYDCQFYNENTDEFFSDHDNGTLEPVFFRASPERSDCYIIKCPHFRHLDYETWMYSKEWRQKRNRKLKEAGYKCEICGTAKNLQVHHITYENLGYEPMDDLLVVCKKCHEKLHETDLKQKEEIDCSTLE